MQLTKILFPTAKPGRTTRPPSILRHFPKVDRHKTLAPTRVDPGAMRCGALQGPGILPTIKPAWRNRRRLLKFAGALVAAATLWSAPALAEVTIFSAGDSTSGTYMDYMKTVCARAGNPRSSCCP